MTLPFTTLILTGRKFICDMFFRRKNHLVLRMPQTLLKVNHTTGEIGAWLGEEIVCIYGAMLLPWNCPMAVMDGLGSFWTVNWPQCTLVEVPREGQIALKIEANSWRSYSEPRVRSNLELSVSRSCHMSPILGLLLETGQSVVKRRESCKYRTRMDNM